MSFGAVSQLLMTYFIQVYTAASVKDIGYPYITNQPPTHPTNQQQPT